MALTYTYPDAYLAKFCTEEREARALADVELMAAGTPDAEFSADWTERLTIVQCYILACLENQADAEDLFTAKLKSYRSQLSVLLPQALAAAAAAANVGAGAVGLYSIELERS
jgi:hypothetical protein